MKKFEVLLEKLRWQCDPAIFDFDCTKEIAPLREFIGQDRAIQFGLSMGHDGYNICKTKGLTGGQGAMIPTRNIDNLMLRQGIIDAVKAGQFHVWAVSTIDEGIEILTDAPMGRLTDRLFPENTISFKVDWALKRMALKLKQYSGTGMEMTHEYEKDS